MITELIAAAITAALDIVATASTVLVAVPFMTYRVHGIRLSLIVMPGLKLVKFVVTINRSSGDISIGLANSSCKTNSVSDASTIFLLN